MICRYATSINILFVTYLKHKVKIFSCNSQGSVRDFKHGQQRNSNPMQPRKPHSKSFARIDVIFKPATIEHLAGRPKIECLNSPACESQE